jgi:hypothetical protein
MSKGSKSRPFTDKEVFETNFDRIFRNEQTELVQAYPVQYTFITSIETKDEYDARKAK